MVHGACSVSVLQCPVCAIAETPLPGGLLVEEHIANYGIPLEFLSFWGFEGEGLLGCWHISRLPKKLDHSDDSYPSNQANQILDPPIKT